MSDELSRKEMGMKRNLAAWGAAILLIFGSSCNLFESSPTSPPSSPPAPRGGIDLNSPTGGLTEADETPAFGEPETYALLANETPVDDPYNAEVEGRLAKRLKGATIYEFRAIWGQLVEAASRADTDYCPLDWSGTLHIDGGIIILEKTIAFENDDYAKRIDRSTIAWVSNTGPRVDGIQVKIIVPPARIDSTDSDKEPALVLTTGPYSRTFTMEELKNLNLIANVDTCGNGISIASHVKQPLCPHGYLIGTWKKVAPDTLVSPDSSDVRAIVLGHFRGIWIGDGGKLGGYLKGVYGVSGAGTHVFFGKYIDMNGRFKGILRGTYGPSPNAESAESRHGWFEGEWIGKNAVAMGKLKGHWVEGNSGAGFFHGVWGMLCSSIP
jgi:hypothetical protein